MQLLLILSTSPYLKQMTSNKEIELLKQEIKMLQSKLSFLEELEKTKTPVEEAFKEVYGIYPVYPNDVRFGYFKAGFHAAYEEKVND